MCKMKVAVNKLMLGSRELGWELWDGKGVLEQTTKQIKDTIKSGERVYGLMIGKSGELELDTVGFFTTDLMLHSHIGNYKPMTDGAGVTNQVLICVGCKTSGGKKSFDCISSNFEQMKISEEEMKAYLKIGLVTSGVKLVGDEIEVAPVETERIDSNAGKQREKKDLKEKRDKEKITSMGCLRFEGLCRKNIGKKKSCSYGNAHEK